MERINIRVDKRTKQELKAEARATGRSPSQIVRTAIERHLKTRREQETCLDIARRVGLVGIYRKAPPDLSTNKRHFDGFGRD